MSKNILWYIGFPITIGGLIALWQIYDIKAWIIGMIISFGSILEALGYDEV